MSQHDHTGDGSTDAPLDERTRADLAAEYALGLLGPDEARAFEALVAVDPSARAELDEQRALLALAMVDGNDRDDSVDPPPMAPRAAPPPLLRDRVLAGIRGEFQSVLAMHGRWQVARATSGAEVKTLYRPREDGASTSLLRAPASARIGDLDDVTDAAVFVVAGDLRHGDERFSTGDLVPAVQGGAQRWSTASGCTVLVVERGSAPPAGARRHAVRTGDGAWRDLGGGTRLKPLGGGRGETTDIMLLEMAPGSVLPEHEHDGLEELYMLRGDCQAEGQSLHEGDYHRAARGSEHHATTTEHGCLMLVVVRHTEARAA
jgi:quercetin dioxygenase-like cupin family protein